jgi:hypothetical protein
VAASLAKSVESVPFVQLVQMLITGVVAFLTTDFEAAKVFTRGFALGFAFLF